MLIFSLLMTSFIVSALINQYTPIMKTRHTIALALLLFLTNSFTNLKAQTLFDSNEEFITFSIPSEDVDMRTYEVTLDDEFQYDNTFTPSNIPQYEAQENVAAFALSMLAFGVGFGFTEFDTLWCLHAEYYLRLALLKGMAMYGAIGFAYNGVSGDFFDTTLFEATLKLLMFSVLVKRYQQVRLLYGILGAYGFGNDKFPDGFKTDITRITVGLVLGLQILLSQQWSFLIQTNILNYQEQTNDSNGIEVTTNSTWGFINKNNILAFSLVYTFGNRRR